MLCVEPSLFLSIFSRNQLDFGQVNLYFATVVLSFLLLFLYEIWLFISSAMKTERKRERYIAIIKESAVYILILIFIYFFIWAHHITARNHSSYLLHELAFSMILETRES